MSVCWPWALYRELRQTLFPPCIVRYCIFKSNIHSIDWHMTISCFFVLFGFWFSRSTHFDSFRLVSSSSKLAWCNKKAYRWVNGMLIQHHNGPSTTLLFSRGLNLPSTMSPNTLTLPCWKSAILAMHPAIPSCFRDSQSLLLTLSMLWEWNSTVVF